MCVRNEIRIASDDVPITVHVVVESELLILLDVTISKDTHANMGSDSPFGYVAVWSATVIQKSSDASSLGGVNVLLLIMPGKARIQPMSAL
jgi:hypothetical protein